MRTLLLADDNVTVQRVIALTFAHEPVRVVTASDGHQAMDRVVLDRPDIVLAGTTLPQVNGYELARFVRSKAELKNVPVLLLSGAFETVDEAQLKSSGAAGVIEKPVEPTTVISRVKELLGLKGGGDRPAPVDGRLVTPPAVTSEDRTATPPPVAASAPPRPITPTTRGDDPGPEPPADPLDSALDTLDDHMAGRVPAAQRNPAPPLARTKAHGDPRSPGRLPAPGATADGGNPVYEVDDGWFADSASPGSREDTPRETAGATRAPEPQAPGPRPDAASVSEMDDEWFAEEQKPREARELEQKQFAAEMGIHEVESAPAAEPATPVERVTPIEAAKPVERVGSDEFEPEPVARSLPIDWFAQGAPKRQPAPPVVAEPPAAPPPLEVARVAPIAITEFDSRRPMTSATPGRVADDFAALLAFEQGENMRPPMIEPVIHAVTPEITPEMLEQIASTVAARLHGSIRVEPKAPEITGEMLKTMAYLVSQDVRNHIKVEPAAPELSEGMLQFIAANVADRLRDSVRVEAKTPEITESMLNHIAASVAYLLRDAVHVEAKAPEITDEMLGRMAEHVAARLKDSIRVEPAIPELNASMLDQIAGTVTARLTDTVEGTMAGSVQAVIAALKESVSEAVKTSAVPPELTDAMLDHMAWTVTDRIMTAMPTPPPAAAPVISEEMLNLVAARVAERIEGNFSVDRLKDSIAESVRDTVRTVVADTSERLVREEIERIKSKAQ